MAIEGRWPNNRCFGERPTYSLLAKCLGSIKLAWRVYRSVEVRNVNKARYTVSPADLCDSLSAFNMYVIVVEVP